MQKYLSAVQMDIIGILIQTAVKYTADLIVPAQAVYQRQDAFGTAQTIIVLPQALPTQAPDHLAVAGIIGIVLQTPVRRIANQTPPARVARLPDVPGTAPVIIVTKALPTQAPAHLAAAGIIGIAARIRASQVQAVRRTLRPRPVPQHPDAPGTARVIIVTPQALPILLPRQPAHPPRRAALRQYSSREQQT